MYLCVKVHNFYCAILYQDHQKSGEGAGYELEMSLPISHLLSSALSQELSLERENNIILVKLVRMEIELNSLFNPY